MKKNNLRAVMIIFVLVMVSLPNASYAVSDSPGTAISFATNGIFTRSNSVPGQTAPLSAASTPPPGYCELNATNVHMSNSTPQNVAADAIVSCAYGQTFRISSLVVTLHKVGFIEQHYLTGPTDGGVATYSAPFQYNNFKTPCNSSTNSTYWSTAHAVGVYGDGTPSSVDVTSPQFPLPCGTSF